MYYDFETFDIPVNPETKTEYPPYYIGPRYGDSLEMHRQFANKTKAMGPDECPSYHFKFPPNQNVIDAIEHNLSRAKRAFQKTKFNAHRYFVGMNPLLVEDSVDSAIRNNKIQGLDDQIDKSLLEDHKAQFAALKAEEKPFVFDSSHECGNLDLVL